MDDAVVQVEGQAFLGQAEVVKVLTFGESIEDFPVEKPDIRYFNTVFMGQANRLQVQVGHHVGQNLGERDAEDAGGGGLREGEDEEALGRLEELHVERQVGYLALELFEALAELAGLARLLVDALRQNY